MADLNEMLIFTKVVEAGSFTGAAKLLSLPKSTVSRKIAQLERRLGTRLLQRTTRSIRLSELGEIFYQRCATIIAEAEAAELLLSRHQEVPQGVLRLSAPADMAQVVGELMAAYLQRFPQVEVELDLSNRYVDLIEEGFDLAIRAGQLADSSLIAQRIGGSRPIVCATPDYLQQNPSVCHPTDLLQHAVLLHGDNKRRQNLLFRRSDEQQSVPLSGRLLANHLSAVKAACLQGIGIALLPQLLCGMELGQGRLVQLLPEWQLPEEGIYLVYPSARYVSPKVSRFVELMIEQRPFKA